MSNKPARLQSLQVQAQSFRDVKISTTSFSHNVSWHDNGIKTPNQSPSAPSSAEESSLYEFSSLCVGAWMQRAAGCWQAQGPTCRDVQGQSPCWGVCPHGALTVSSSPSGRGKARTPAVGLWRCISLGCAIRGALSQQLPSQHQGQGPCFRKVL